MKRILTISILLIWPTSKAVSQASHTSQQIIAIAGDTLKFDMPQIEIMADREGVFQRTPGAVSLINQKEIQLTSPLSGNEVMRRAPGVHVVDEEGVGLRTNIGIRGLDPDRSRNVLILEDGIPVALNPYGEPEMYYTPAIERMERVEILKGSGQIMFGPQTIGGVINYITADPTLDPTTRINLRGGMGGFFSGMISHSQTHGNTGVMINYLHKRADQVGYVGFNIHDFNTKFKFRISDKSTIGVKLSAYDELSNATYIGLTQSMFDAGNNDFVLMAPDDKLHIRRYAISATHQYQRNRNFSIKSTAYAYTTTRNWQRQDFVLNGSANTRPSNFTGQVWGDSSIANGAVFMRNSNGHRNRQFEVAGLETRLNYRFDILGKENQLDAGIRLQHERAYEQLLFGTKANAGSGNMIENEMRTGLAFSAFVQNRIDLDKRLSITPGLRLEQFNYERDINRRRFNNIVTDTSILAASNLTQLIPGIGANYNLNKNTTVFAGVHRGFAPPRVKDAIDGGGTVQQLDAELSWNYELGSRITVATWLTAEITAFRLDFSNQIIPISQSSDGLGTGLVNGGRTLHQGIESAFNLDFGKLFGTKNSLVFHCMATYIDARFANDRFIAQGNDTLNISGNRTPYAPKWLLTAGLSLEAKNGLRTRILLNHVGEQFGDILNRTEPTANGREGILAAYTLLDASIIYPWRNKYNFSLSVKNLTNERYMASRRPQGIRVGLPAFVLAGFEIRI
ncbi:MAG: TonB-dependent receptor family protein [Bacteroidia bacterium]